MSKRIETFDEFIKNTKYVSKEDKKYIEFHVNLIGKIIEAREKKGYSQRELATICQIKQPEIARIEGMKCSPQIDTLIKILTPLGYKLTINKI